MSAAQARKPGANPPRVHILVHNVSHQDMLVGFLDEQQHLSQRSLPRQDVTPRPTTGAPSKAPGMMGATFGGKPPFGRPVFSAFDEVSRAVVQHLNTVAKPALLAVPFESPSAGTPVFSTVERTRLFSAEPADQPEGPPELLQQEGWLAAGVQLQPQVELPGGWDSVRLRDPAVSRRPAAAGEGEPAADVAAAAAAAAGEAGEAAEQWPVAGATACFFPLLAVLLQRWSRILKAAAQYGEGRRILVLVSGSGMPRNPRHHTGGNSTEFTAIAAEFFVRQLFPSWEVRRAHSGAGILRFDDSVHFANSVLRPLVDQERATLAAAYGAEWSQRMHVTISLAGGAPARTAAIQASLRGYNPDFLHMYELKTLWHRGVCAERDVDLHSADQIKAEPAGPAAEQPMEVRSLCAAMQRHYDTFRRVRDAGVQRHGFSASRPHDMAPFWMRKSRKPVLATLLIRRPISQPFVGRPADFVDKEAGWQYKLYRGLNMEVSLPTGSLCSERAAIASALADEPGLLREECVGVAVLSAVLMPSATYAKFLPKDAQPVPMIDRAGSKRSSRPPSIADGSELGSPSGASNSDAPTSPPGSPQRSVGRESAGEPWEGRPAKRHNTSDTLSSYGRAWATARSARRAASVESRPVAQLPAVPPTASPARSPAADPVVSPSPSPPPPLAVGGGGSSSAASHPVQLPVRRTQQPPSSPVRSKQPWGCEWWSSLHVGASQASANGLGAGVLGSDVAMNPLPPCGACREWLLKISEVNPDFKVCTFTDTSCQMVYVRPVQ